MAYGDATNAYLLQLAGQSAPSALAVSAVANGDYEINEAFATGGYATPIDLSLISDSTIRAQLTAKLATVSNAIAGYVLSTPTTATGKRGAPEKVAKDAADARAWLNKVATRQVIVTPLVVAGAASISQTGMQVVGDNTWDATAGLFDLVLLPLD